MAEYQIEIKGKAFLESFVDPGAPFDPRVGPPDVWFRRVIENGADFVVAFQHDGTITYVADSSTFLLGYEPAELIGTNALDLLHPDDLENAADTVYHAAEVEGWRPPRPLRLRHADGTYSTFEIAGLSLFDVPEVRSIVCVGRQADDSKRVDNILGLLAAQSPLAPILDEIVYLMVRPGWHLGIAIQYDADLATVPTADTPNAGLAVAHTALDPVLARIDRTAAGTPWAVACETNEPVYDLGMKTIDAATRAVAEQHGFATCWAIPIVDPGVTHGRPVCIVVWNAEEQIPELGQLLLLDRMRTLLELALLGRARAAELERAALTDALTGLANRRAFEAALDVTDPGQLALLVLDLDGFKQINDLYGHAAGDTVIRNVAARIASCVRHGDVAARVGGDEFALICQGIESEDAIALLGERLLAAVTAPITLDDGTDVQVGISIGIALADEHVALELELLLQEADRQLYAAKGAGKGQFRISHA